MSGSLAYIDLDPETFLKESFFISYFSKGGFSLKDVQSLDVNDYEFTVSEANRIQSLLNPKEQTEV